MSTPTLPPPGSSRASGKAFILEPRRSRALTLWWVALHGLLAASCLSSALPTIIRCACIGALVAHAVLRSPARPQTLLRRTDGAWTLPDQGLADLRLGAGTSIGPFWICLRFGHGARAVRVLLLRDQLDFGTWRALQAELRRTVPSDGI